MLLGAHHNWAKSRRVDAAGRARLERQRPLLLMLPVGHG
jgi:hypothetical protein